MEEKNVSVISIIVEDKSISSAVNQLLHEFSQYIVGRMGIPYPDRDIAIICVVLDASGNITSSLSGKLGMLKGVKTKTIVSKQEKKKEG